MTNTEPLSFEEVHRLIKRSDILGLRHAIDNGLDANLTNQFSWSLLMLTAIEGDTAIGELLFSYGAELHASNDFGETALSLAAHAGHEPFIRWLLRHGAKTDCNPHGWKTCRLD